MNRLLVILKRPLLAILLMLLLQGAAGLMLLISPSITLMSIALLIVNITMCIFSLYIFRRGQYTRSQYVPSSSTWRQNLWGFLGCVFGIFALNLMTELTDIPNTLEKQIFDICRNPWGVAAITLGAPLGEEMLFRWGFMGHLLHHNRSVVASIIISSLLFGVTHINPAQVFFATAMGIILGIMYWKTGNILLPILVHMFNNSIACAQVWFLGENIDAFSLTDSLGGATVAWYVVAACSVMCVVLMGWYAASKPAVQNVAQNN